MDQTNEIEKKILPLGGNLQTSNSREAIVTFYHKDFSDSELNYLSKIEGIISLAFYACNIKNSDLEKIIRIKSLEKLAFYSCQDITDQALTYLKNIPKLNTLVFVDVNISKEAIKAYKRQFPEINIREPSYKKDFSGHP